MTHPMLLGLIVLAGTVLAGCEKPLRQQRIDASYSTKGEITVFLTERGPNVYRFVDTENGVVCYAAGLDSLSCMKAAR